MCIKKLISMFIIISMIMSCESDSTTSSPDENTGTDPDKTNFYIASSVMKHNGVFPTANTCDGDKATPAIEWGTVPNNVVSYVVMMHHYPGQSQNDSDAHWYWVLYNISASKTSLSTNESQYV